MQKTTVIFDFDGTLANTVPLVRTVANILAKENNIPQFSENDLEKLRSKTPNEIIKLFKIPFYKIPFLALRAQQLLKSYMKDVSVFPGIAETIDGLDKAGIMLGIVTSNSETNVREFLQKNRLDMFDFVRSEKNIFGKHASLLNVVNKYKLKKEQILYVGDEIRDIIASRKAGIQIASVSWGFNTIKALEKFRPDYLLRTPKDLLKLLL